MSQLFETAPSFSERDAQRLVAKYYGLKGNASALPSERDQNFKITRGDGRVCVLKIANAAEQLAVLEMQQAALAHINTRHEAHQAGTALCPRVLESVNHHTIETISGPDDTPHMMWLISHLAGKPLALAKPHTRELLSDLGRVMATLDRYLADFSHPAALRVLHWDLKCVEDVVGRLMANIFSEERRGLVRKLLYRFVAQVVPLRDDLRTQVIHNDANDYNVLVTPAGCSHRVTGIVDFGDILQSQLVNELAIACAYVMLDKPDPLDAACAVTAGFHQIIPLTESELQVLFDLILMRLCASVCHSAHQSQANPVNEYATISEKPAWSLLARLASVHPRLACYRLRQACGLEPLKGRASILNWLKGQAGTFRSVVDADLSGSAVLGLDLSVGSPLLDVQGASPPVSGMGPGIFAGMRKAGARVGIGGYGRARFQPPGDTCGIPDAATIHLGMDLFISQDSPVFAFADGTVHSLNPDSGRGDSGASIILQHTAGDNGHYYSFYGCLAKASLAGWRPGMHLSAGQLLGRVGGFLENGQRPPHLHFQLLLDRLGCKGTFPSVVAIPEADVWKAICPDPNVVLGIDTRHLPAEGIDTRTLLDLRRQILGRNLSLAYDTPLKIVRGLGQYLIADDGRAYLDCVNNVSHVGHCHPRVIAASQQQTAVLNTNTRYLHDGIIRYARRLLSTFPHPLSVCFFVCTGSEANELALRMARIATGRNDIVTVNGAYHGNTQGLIDISPYKHDGPGGRGAPSWVHTAEMPCGYRGPHKGFGAAVGRAYAGYVGKLVDNLLNDQRAPAAFICESMLGCGGQVILPEGYLKNAFQYVRTAGGLCIADEVQTGFGRVGSHFWAFESQQVVPDIVTLGKPMGNGQPLAAVVTTAEIADAFANGMEYFNTYGGNPVSCAIGEAVLDVIEAEGLKEQAREVGSLLLTELKRLEKQYPLIGHVRGQGLYLGIELVKDPQTLAPAAEEAGYIANQLKASGILMSTDGPLHNVLKIKPPLVFNAKNARQVVAALDEILQHDCLN